MRCADEGGPRACEQKVAPAELDTMFRNVESVYRLNRGFLKVSLRFSLPCLRKMLIIGFYFASISL
jgi:hypothetical protein